MGQIKFGVLNLNPSILLWQASGEAQYVNDIHEQLGELHGAFVLSSLGNAGIDSFDPSGALVGRSS